MKKLPIIFLLFALSLSVAHASVPYNIVGSTVPDKNLGVSRMLQTGSKGLDVKIIQQFLKDIGYYTGKIDGSYGKGMVLAVKNFQGDNNVKISGIVDTETLNKMNQRLNSPIFKASSSVVFVTPNNLADMEKNLRYEIPITAKGGKGAYLWSVENGSILPPGLTLSPLSCVTTTCKQSIGLVGTPNQAGYYYFTLVVKSGNDSASQNFTLNIVDKTVAPYPHISSLSTNTAKVGDTITVIGTNLSGAHLNFAGYYIPTSYAGDTKVVFTIPNALSNCFASNGRLCSDNMSPLKTGYSGIYFSNPNSGYVSNLVQILITR